MISRGLLLLLILLLLWFGTAYLSYWQRVHGLIQESAQWPTAYTVGSAEKPPLTYVVLGDSVAVGTGASTKEGSYAYAIAHALSKDHFIHVVNIAVVGARIDDVLTKQLPQLSSLKPQVLSVSVGGNDATHGTPYATYSQSLSALLSGLQNSSADVVLFANSPHVSLAPLLPPLFRQYAGSRAQHQNNILLSQLSAGFSKIHVVDLYDKGQLNPHENPAYYAADRFHPADAGYAKWAVLFIEALVAR